MRWLLLLATVTVPSQLRAVDIIRATDQASVSAMLSSADVRDQAWGAWIAGRDQMRELAPAISKIVAARLIQEDRDSQCLLDVALDGLIQLRAQMPPELLQSLFPKHRSQALVLFSFAGAPANNALLSMLATEHGLAWYTAAGILLPRKPSGFAALILRDLKFTVEVTISRNGDISSGHSDLFSTTIGDGGTTIMAGFPPIAHYIVTPYAAPGAVVVAIGPKPVYYERSVGPAGFTSAGSLDVSGPTSGELVRYIAALLDSDHGLKASESRAVAWRDQATLDAETAAIRSDIAQRYSLVVRELRDKTLLSDDEAARLSVPRIEVVIHDKRTF